MMKVKAIIGLMLLASLLMAHPAYAATTGAISASPNPTSSGSTTITWATSDASMAQVYVNANGGGDVLLAQGPSGSSTPTWIQPGQTYTFSLYGGTAHTVLLNQVIVVGSSPPSISASPNPVSTLTTGSTVVSWNTGDGSYGQVYVSINGQADTIVVQGASGTISIPWIQSGSTYLFRLYAGTTHTTVLAQVWVTTAAPAASISASPNPTNTGSTVVTWATNNNSVGQVWVSVNGGAEILFAQGSGASNTAPWIQAGNTYVFTLYAGTSHSVVMAQTTVTGTRPPALTAFPNPPSNGTSTITWSTGDGTVGQVYVSINGGADAFFAQGATGSASATWIQAGNTYVFKLFAGTSHTTQLVQITVTPATSLSVTPPSGGSSTLTWNTGDGTTVGQVYLSLNGGQDILVAQGPSGTSTLNWMQPGNTYLFRLFLGTSHSVVLAQQIVTT